jgi:transcriptional regulator with XRE-family HTH domain
MAKADNTARLLREIRRRRGATLQTAADHLGITPGHLSRLERGEKSPSADVVSRAAKYYDVDQDLLALEQGRAPDDIVRILREHPELLERLRAEYGNTGAS